MTGSLAGTAEDAEVDEVAVSSASSAVPQALPIMKAGIGQRSRKGH